MMALDNHDPAISVCHTDSDFSDLSPKPHYKITRNRDSRLMAQLGGESGGELFVHQNNAI